MTVGAHSVPPGSFGALETTLAVTVAQIFSFVFVVTIVVYRFLYKFGIFTF